MSDRANGAGSSDDVVARAIKELIDSVPGEEEAPAPEAETSTVQPWAETASPSASDKRPLEALLGEYAARVAAARETSRQCFASARRAYLESAIENESTPVAGMSSQAFQAQQAKDLEALEALQRSLAGLFKELEAQVNVRADLQVPVTVVEPEEPA